MAIEMNKEWKLAEAFLKYHMLPHQLVDSFLTVDGQVFTAIGSNHCVWWITFRFENGEARLVKMVPLVEEKRK